MKKNIYLIIIALFIVVFVLCFISMAPSVGTESVVDIDRYMEVNETTQNILNQYYKGIFPKTIHEIPDDSAYKYEYSCALFGEPDCVVYLQCKYTTQEFVRKKAQIEEESVSIYSLNNNLKLYSCNDSFEKNFDYYMDDVIEDGRVLVFEFAIVDEETQHIQYIFLFQHDGQTRFEFMREVFDHIEKTENGTKPLK